MGYFTKLKKIGMSGLGIPYMGSKRGIASDIVHFIRKENPKAKYFYDVFGGGGSITFEALQQGFEKVYYIDLDTGMCNLMKQIKEGIPKGWDKRVSSKDFKELKDKDDAYSVAMSICWSFGNKRNGYLYSSDIEEWKKALHYAVVNEDYSYLDKYGLNIRLSGKTIKDRRLELRDKIAKSEKTKTIDITKRGHRNVEIDGVGAKSLESLQDNEGLKRIQSLERVESLERLESLEILNISYKNLKIQTPLDETVVYCDPPYRGTGTYKVQKSAFNYKALDKRFRELPCIAYMSEENPHKVALTMTKRRTFQMNSGNFVYEVLYTNGYKQAEKQPMQPDLFI